MAETAAARHLLIPFAGRGSPACRAATAGLRLPKLEALLARLAPSATDTRDDGSFSSPHERALATALGIAAPDGCIPWAAREARQLALPASEVDSAWGFIDLCHWQVDLSDVVLGDPAQTQLSAAESQALLDAASPLFVDDGIQLFPAAAPGRWLARGELFRGLPTASLDRAIGNSISQWSQITDAARPLRRLQNEIQMLLYTERVNDERTARGLPPINSFWLSGTGALPTTFQAHGPAPVVVDLLRAPALADDGAAWAAAWAEVDAGPMAGLLAEAERGGADVVLTLCGDVASQRFTVQQRGLSGWVKRLFKREQAPAVLEAL